MRRAFNIIYCAANVYNKPFLIRVPTLENCFIKKPLIHIRTHEKEKVMTSEDGSTDNQIIFSTSFAQYCNIAVDRA